MPGTISPPPRVSDPDMHYGTCVTHVPWCIPGSLTSGFWSQWRGKHSRHSRRMRSPNFYVSGKRLILHRIYTVPIIPYRPYVTLLIGTRRKRSQSIHIWSLSYLYVVSRCGVSWFIWWVHIIIQYYDFGLPICHSYICQLNTFDNSSNNICIIAWKWRSFGISAKPGCKPSIYI